jgi:hypothetical protein
MKYDAVDVKYEIRHECGRLESVSLKHYSPIFCVHRLLTMREKMGSNVTPMRKQNVI